ncbi:hypothetical protein HUG10_13520 [Halorarum halophilum]|uniref:DUF7827 domain-containing protein n=1 Tax=Halorarum halophilum TaxID=2743090 RepID=A0A7D5GFT4_9EURY|nr:hypothetical protein [Halobaculum halophilum]QLG28508.1 hypothetical protein HUG10_13520 [Halobaculum halophilum]
MSAPPARPLLRAIAVVLLLASSAGIAAAHPIVVLEDRSPSVESGGRVEIPLRFHDTDRATLTVAGGDGVELEATVVDADGDGSMTVTLDTAAVRSGNTTGALSAPGDAVRNVTIRGVSGDRLNQGEYAVTVEPPGGGRDEGTLTITPGESTATPSGAGAPGGTPDDGIGTAKTSNSSTTTPATSPGYRLPWPPVVLLALFGPAVPVVALVVASRRT